MLRQLLRFHLRSTVRVTLRNTAIQATVLCVAIGLSPDPASVLAGIGRGLAAGESGWWLAVAVWALWNASSATRPLATTLHGWHLHLPVGGDDERRAAMAALWICQAPVLLFAAVLATAVGLIEGLPWLKVVPAATVLGLGAAATVLPWRPTWGRILGGVATIGAATATWTGIAAGAAALVLQDRWAERLRVDRPPSADRRSARRIAGAWGLFGRIAGRSVGRKLPGLWLSALVPMGCAWLFLNNNELTGAEAAIGVRVGGGLAVLAVLLPLAGELKIRRPPWAWARSLPWTSRRRVVGDAAFLALAALPALIGAAVLSVPAAVSLAAGLAYQALRLADAIRREIEGATRLGPLAVAEASIVQLAVAVSAWAGLLLLILVPLALKLGERRDQAQKVSRWLERHHLEGGDPAS